VEIHVIQGERKMAGDNKTIGRFHLDGIPPAPRGVPQIEVTFDIDANGILHVGAKDLGTGKEQKITITASSGLSKDEVENMRREGEAHAAEDAKRREEAETKNRSEATVYETEKFLKEHGAKVSADKKTKAEAAVAALKEAIKSGSVDRMKPALEALNTEMQALSSELYAQAAKQRGGPGAGGAGGPTGGPAGEPPPGAGAQAKPEGDVIDADFEMVDDDKKKKDK
jgi:molecular chaperone DnaK